MRDYYEHLKTTEFRLLPQALDLSLTPSEQSFAAGRVIFAEEDRCLRVSAIHLLEQDRYVTQLEQKRRQDQALLWECQERDSQGALERASLLEAVAKLQDELNSREEVHRAEVADL